MIIDFMLTPVWDAIQDISGNTFDPSLYTPTSGFSTINGSAITEGGNLVIEGGPGDLSDYWTSAQTKTYVDSAFTIAEDHITDVERVTASAYTELHDDILELSARTGPDMSLYTPTSGFSTINGSAITEGGNLVISADLTNYWTSAQTQTAISAATQDMVTSSYVSTIWRGTQLEYDAITVKDPNTFYIIVSS